ncbi:MAG: EutP/PduV family microcompartment system protein [Eubacterium sp.]|nr:EutP/PduV family microcompartment system protein [Eubacterium sp.]
MKRVIFVGNIGSGKTTLSQVIHGEDIEYAKTQMVTVWGDDIVDTPGEYLEAGYMKGVLNVTAAEAQVIGLVCSAPEPRNKFSPGYGGSFAKDVIGIVTKIDIADPIQIERAEKMLRMAGARKIFKISSYTGEGVPELAEYLAESPEEADKIISGLKLRDTKVISVSKTSRK